MHDSVQKWVRETIDTEHITGKRVLEVGSYVENGTIRPHLESLRPSYYLGVDMRSGPGVDMIVNCETLTDVVGSEWDFVISTEMLEHVRDWRKSTYELFKAVKLGGMVAITTRSPGFPYHGYPEDHWRFTLPVMHQIVNTLGFRAEQLIYDPSPRHPGVFLLATRETDSEFDKLQDITVLRVEECEAVQR